MDWTAIIVTAIPALCGIISAYMAHGAKKKTEVGNAEILERIENLEKESESQAMRLQVLCDQNAGQDKKLEVLGAQSAKHAESLKQIEDKLSTQESVILSQHNQLSKITNELDDNNLRTLRLDLLHAIETDPNNQLIILDLANKYFVDMKGNCYMSKVFQEWADDHNVNITSIFNKG